MVPGAELPDGGALTVRVSEARPGSSDIDAAAQIWAEATAVRDGDDDVADLSVSGPVIAAVLERSAGAFVLVAHADDGTAAGFGAVKPVAGSPQSRAEVCYLGVRPSRWGRGIGELLLREIQARLKAAGFSHVQLLVYVDNPRATALYERLGWRPAGEPAPHPRTGKPEQRYELELSPHPHAGA